MVAPRLLSESALIEAQRVAGDVLPVIFAKRNAGADFHEGLLDIQIRFLSIGVQRCRLVLDVYADSL
jgi:hypothetical protein